MFFVLNDQFAGLKVQGQLYVKCVIPPKPTEILSISMEDFDHTMEMKICKGEQLTTKGNTFIGYLIDANTHQPIRRAYLKLRLMHPRARHIVCAFNIPGIGPHFQDTCDDDDYGASRPILKAMIDSGIESKAIFVVRYMGQKLNNERFSSYLEAAERVLQQHPTNRLRGEDQHFKKADNIPQTTTKKTYTQALGMYARGGSRGFDRSSRGGKE